MPNNEIETEKQIQMLQNLIQEKSALSYSSETSSKSSCSVFDKFKEGSFMTIASSAFKLYGKFYSFENDSHEDSHSEISTNNRNRGSYRKYTLEEKEIAVEKIVNGEDIKKVSKEFGIPRRNLLRWKKNGCQRKEGGGRPTDQEMENILIDKIKNGHIKGEKEVREMAAMISRSKGFKASKGWFSKFLRRVKERSDLRQM